MAQPLLQVFFNKLERLQRAVLMLDYDGTLAPFKKERKAAYPYRSVSNRLAQLSSNNCFRIIIISGRMIKDLKQLLHGINPLPELWGSHGLEHLSQDGSYWRAALDEATQKGLRKAKRICLQLSGTKRCEKKPFGVAFHFRGMKEISKRKILDPLQKKWEEICRDCDLALYPFDGGLEVRVKAKNKGQSVRQILKGTSLKAAFAYLGDDLTDETAFEALGKKGLKILVRPKPRKSRADMRLKPPVGVTSFFDRCLSICQNKGRAHA